MVTQIELQDPATTPFTADDNIFHPPRSVSAGRGWGWIAEAWPLFKAHPGTWIGAVLLCYLILIVLSLVPLLGGLATTLIGPMLIAGLMLGAHAQYHGERVTVGHLFAGLAQRPGPLALVGLLYLLFAIGIGLIIVLIVIAALASSGLLNDVAALDLDTFDQNSIDTLTMMSPALLLSALIAMLLGIPLAMAVFFAPALVALNNVPVMRAFKLSFMGCLKNILPFLVFGLIAILMIIIGMIPLMLGLILVMPVLTIAVYIAYRDLFYH